MHSSTEHDRGEHPDAGPLSSLGRSGAATTWSAACLPPWSQDAGPEVAGRAPSGEAPRYRLRRLVARGGMGEVWEALQVSLGRVVAVKRLREPGGKPHPDAAMQFQGEALLAARLEHPNILPVHDLAEDADGSPLLAMKLITGDSWADQLDRDRAALPREEFLEKHLAILATVAQAVAFAHGRGVVHRDLKPSQVLVGAYGEVLLTDWGLALCLDEHAAGDALLPHCLPTPRTATGPSGTPVLMAPEQTMSSAEGVGPWTDVYLLGGILYFLLTGSFPHDAPTTREALRKAARGVVAPPGERAPGIPTPAELEALAMQALAPAPGDRAASAAAFHEALVDYLRGASRLRQARALLAEAEAALPGAAYAEHPRLLEKCDRALQLWPRLEAARQLAGEAAEAYVRAALAAGDRATARANVGRVGDTARREALLARVDEADRAALAHARQRRNAIATAFLLALVLVLAGGLSALSYRAQARAIRAERDRAETQQGVAMGRAAAADRLVGFLLGDLAQELDPTDPRDARNIEDLAAEVLRHFRELDTSQDSDEARLAHADSLVLAAENLHALGQYAAAEELSADAAAIGLALAPQAAGTGVALRLHGRALLALNSFPQAEARLRESLSILEGHKGQARVQLARALGDLGELLSLTNRRDDAIEAHERALALLQALPGAEPAIVATAQSNLASSLQADGRIPEAIEHYNAALALHRSHEASATDFANTLQNLATVLREVGDAAAASDAYAEATALLEAELGPTHTDVAIVLNNHAVLLRDLGELDRASDLSGRAIEVASLRLGPDHHLSATFRGNRGLVLDAMGLHKEAIAEFEQALAGFQAVHGEECAVCASVLTNLANAALSVGDDARAGEAFAAAMALNRRLAGPGHPQTALTSVNYADFLADTGRVSEARDLLQPAIEVLSTAYGESSPRVALALLKLEKVHRLMGDPAAALEASGRALAILREAWGMENESTQEALSARLAGHQGVALACEAEGQAGEAQAAWEALADEFEAGDPKVASPTNHAYAVQAALRCGREERARQSIGHLRAVGFENEDFWAMVEAEGGTPGSNPDAASPP